CRGRTDMQVMLPPSLAGLLSHPDKDLVFAKRQHGAAARSLQVHDHPGAVLQPQIAAAGRAETGLAGALRISGREIGNASELVDRAGRGDFVNPATRARNSADHFEWVGPSPVFQ